MPRWTASARSAGDRLGSRARKGLIAPACGPGMAVWTARVAPAVSPVSASTSARARSAARSRTSNWSSSSRKAGSRSPLIASDKASRRVNLVVAALLKRDSIIALRLAGIAGDDLGEAAVAGDLGGGTPRSVASRKNLSAACGC